MALYSITKEPQIGINWAAFALGPSFEEFSLITADRDLRQGARVRFIIEVQWPFGYLFDLAGAEQVFSGQMPPGLQLVDVYELDASHGVVEARAVSYAAAGYGGYGLLPLLGGIVAFVAANWKLILIAGILLGGIVLAIKGEFVPGLQAIGGIMKWAVIGGIGLGGFMLVREFVH